MKQWYRRCLLWVCMVMIGALSVTQVVQVVSVGGEVSDLHFSIWNDKSRITEFRDFCRHSIRTIEPAVVLASGDLTDAKSVDGMGSLQYEEEWQYYKTILQETGLYNNTVWLDIRGNHDNFNMASLSSATNLYKSHSVQGGRHPRSYLHSVRRAGVSVAFIAVDTTLLPGPKRPFNFVGVLPPSELSLLQRLAEEARASHNHTVWFGHYPTSCIIGPEHGCKDLRMAMSGGVAYLCGHLHSLGGLVPAMHARQLNGLLELELEDWKDGRMFRVMALDGGQFSFIDVRHNTWPLILVTNPSHATYTNTPYATYADTIRVLAWSPSSIRRLSVRIDEAGAWVQLSHVKGPLYSARWQPALYTAGLHTLEVAAEDGDGRRVVHQQPFSMDGSKPSFRLLPSILLTSNISAVFQFLFGCAVCLCILLLCVFRYLHYLMSSSGKRNICRRGIFRWTIMRALPKIGLFAQLAKNVPLVIPLSIQSFLTYLMYLAYGWVCVVLGPIRSCEKEETQSEVPQ
ncbi:hypothetical protein HAZT_HAZT001520 [Hyalella azteca]|uniref:Uncharacterized protein n=1 Tax=Hyalella azteca TaxID=294128 RepID=A0A6A0H0A4_HYAAZ|nr:hypothetical protein HAZT_HAZT001520 [Hyalella azteca]